ncbi:hypothetical protein ACFL5V_08060 [Fibrobacterota bacterium]
MKKSRDIVRRWQGNPIIALDDLPFTSTNIYSAGAIKYQNEYVLLITIENLEGKTAIYTAKSEDRIHFDVASEPLLSPAESGEHSLYEKQGVRDGRLHVRKKKTASFRNLNRRREQFFPKRLTGNTHSWKGPDMADGYGFPMQMI